MIRHEIHIPSSVLQPYVKFFYYFEHQSQSNDERFERVTPDGTIELNFSLEAPFERKENNENISLKNFSYIVSRLYAHYYVKPKGKVRFIGVRFYPWGIHPFLKIPMTELADRIHTLDDIFGKEPYEVQMRINETTCQIDAFRIVEEFLIKRLSDCNAPDKMVIDLSRKICNLPNRSGLSVLLENYALSNRRVEQRFKQSIGISPKGFLKLIRFQRALNTIYTTDKSNLTSVTYESGYFDQSHFIRDFKAFTGITPSEYIREQHPVNDIINRTALIN
jgi:AraC-like DNA-binding protein